MSGFGSKADIDQPLSDHGGGKILASDFAAVVDSVEQRRAMEEYGNEDWVIHAITSQRFHGTMHTWSGKGYGFIRRNDKQPDVFAHISDVMEFMGDQLEVGQRVTFELGQDPKSGKTKAVNVRIS